MSLFRLHLKHLTYLTGRLVSWQMLKKVSYSRQVYTETHIYWQNLQIPCGFKVKTFGKFVICPVASLSWVLIHFLVFLVLELIGKPSISSRLPQWLSGKESAYRAGDTGVAGSSPWLERSPGGENGNLFQYSCPDNPINRGDWKATVSGAAKSWTWLSDWEHKQVLVLAVYYIINHRKQWLKATLIHFAYESEGWLGLARHYLLGVP